MDAKYLEKLSRTVMFKGIDIKDIPHILGCLGSKIMKFGKNDYVVKVNERYTGVFVVLDGEAAVIRESINGNRVTVNKFCVGDFFGEAVAFCDAGTWPATIQALSDCTLMFIHPERILTMCDRPCTFHKVILANMIRVISKKACLLNRKVEYLSLKSITGKLCKYLLEQSEQNGTLTFKLPLNREELADFLNVSRPSMSRELGKLRDDGIIEFYRESVRILDVQRLEALQEE